MRKKNVTPSISNVVIYLILIVNHIMLFQNYSTSWRRMAFMRFVDMYSQDDTTADSVKVDAQVKVLYISTVVFTPFKI